jgi:hypothetical protein
MRYIKKFNESFLDRLEAAVKGKSDKGKLIGEMLKKQNIAEQGFAYTFRYMGGDLTDETKSHPISYLVNYKPNEGKLKVEGGKLSLTDETFNDKKVVNVIPMLDKEISAEGKTELEEHGRIWSSAVIKFDYKFDLAAENPTLTFSNALLFDIEKGTWVKNEDIKIDTVEILDGEVNPETEKALADSLAGTVWNQELVTTYKTFIDECNKRKDIVDIIFKHHSGVAKPEEATQEPAVTESVITKFNRF